jgi:hypothetical protein
VPDRTEVADEPFSDELERWLRDPSPKTLGALTGVSAEKSFAVTILLLMFLPAMPLPTGGVTHVFELVTIIVAMQMVIGRRTIWLPARLARRELGSLTTGKAVPFVIRRVRWFERRFHRRLAWAVSTRPALRVIGLIIIAFTVASAVAPPFSGLDTLPALGVVCLALAVIIEDVVLAVVGTVAGTGGIVLIITIGEAIARFLRHLL